MSRGKHAPRRRGLRRLGVILAVTGVVVVLLGGVAYAGYRYDHARAARVLPGIRIAGIDVGNMTRAQVERALAPHQQSILGRTIQIRVGSEVFDRTAGSLGVRVDVRSAVDRAFDLTSSYAWPARLYHRLLGRPLDVDLQPRVTYDRTAVSSFVQAVASQVESQPRNAALDFQDGRLVSQKARYGAALKTGLATTALTAAVQGRPGEVSLDVRRVAPKVSTGDLGMTIIIRISRNKLYLYDGLKLVKVYPVATGQPRYPTPQGRFEIINKRVNPTWVNPAPTTWGAGEPAVIPPGPNNPLGTRALDLSAPGIRIHGTPDAASIGTYASHGCIRMYIWDSEDLFGRVDVGTPVIIAY